MARFSKKINRRRQRKTKRGKRRSSKQRGGAREYSKNSTGDTANLLNHYLFKRVLNNQTYNSVIQKTNYTTLPFGPSDLLMVIDMQDDFVDRVKEGLTGPEIPNVGKIGAFAVNNGSDIITPIVDLYKKVLDANGKVVFSRDVHPCDHCSFFNHSCKKDNPMTPSGPFPPHCISGSVGSGFVDEICSDLKTRNIYPTIDRGNVSVIFKGCFQDTDSFGAVKYPEDEYGRKRQLKCEPSDLTNTGGFYVNPEHYTSKQVLESSYDAETEIKQSKNPFSVPEELTRIFVVGLAGDYCVCDTAINLKKTYPDKEIIIIHELTRNAFIPFFETDAPQFQRVKDNTTTDKNLTDYAFLFNGTSSKSLTNQERDALTVETLATHFHFLTDTNDLFDRYLNAGVKVMVSPETDKSASTAISNELRESINRTPPIPPIN
jgi:nicotinamidase-related amidase